MNLLCLFLTAAIISLFYKIWFNITYSNAIDVRVGTGCS